VAKATLEEQSWPEAEPRLRAYEVKYAGLWLVLSVAFICVLALEITSPSNEVGVFYGLDFLLWCAFVFDFFWRHHLVVDRHGFWRSWLTWLDVLVVFSFPLLITLHIAVLGLARGARVVIVGVRFIRGGALMGEAAGRAGTFFRRGSLKMLLAICAILVVVLATLVWRFESVHAGSPIHTPADAIWWSIVTLFTVGYGDLYPKTIEGRIFAIGLMLVGIALFGWITASLASLFVENDEKAKRRRPESLHDRFDEVTERLDRIEHLLAEKGVDIQRDAVPSDVQDDVSAL
jgi:voltage-gated potassium channel